MKIDCIDCFAVLTFHSSVSTYYLTTEAQENAYHAYSPRQIALRLQGTYK